MTKHLKNIFSFLPDYLTDTKVEVHDNVIFVISFNNLEIGLLELGDGLWVFKYTDDFKAQNEIRPLPDFPDLNTIYSSDELWPFFIVRIPSLKQPYIQNIIQKEKIDSTSQVELLKRFGKRTIANPYKLHLV